MTIFNSGGTGHGKVTHALFTNCSSSSKDCKVDSVGADDLPWLVRLVTVSSSNYVVIEGIQISILFSGDSCVLDGVTVTATGSAGGIFDNGDSTIALEAELKALGSKVGWKSVLTSSATGAHSGQAPEVG